MVHGVARRRRRPRIRVWSLSYEGWNMFTPSPPPPLPSCHDPVASKKKVPKATKTLLQMSNMQLISSGAHESHCLHPCLKQPCGVFFFFKKTVLSIDGTIRIQWNICRDSFMRKETSLAGSGIKKKKLYMGPLFIYSLAQTLP